MRMRLNPVLLICVLLSLWLFQNTTRAQEQSEISVPVSPLVVQGGPRSEVRALAVSPDGALLATLSPSNVQMWTRGGRVLWSRSVSGDPQALAWSRDGARLAIGVGGTEGFFVGKGGNSAGALELDARDGHITRTMLAGNNTVFHLAYLADGRLQVASGDGPVMWDANGNTINAKPDDLMQTWGGIYPSSDGSQLAVPGMGEGAGIQLWDGALAHKMASLWQEEMPRGKLAWAPDGQSLAVSDGKRVQVWDVATRQPKCSFELTTSLKSAPPTSSDAFDFAFAPQGDAILCVRTDFPDAKEDKNGLEEPGHPRSFAWRLDLVSGKEQLLREGLRAALLKVAFWPDGTLVLGGADNSKPALWDAELRFVRLQNGKLQGVWQAQQPLKGIRRMQLSPDGDLLAITGDDTAIRLWNIASGRLQKTLKVLSSELFALDFSPSGRQIAALDADTLYIFDVQTEKVRQFPGVAIYDRDSVSIAWSPDGKTLAFGDGAGSFLLDVGTGKRHELLCKIPKSDEEEGATRRTYGLLAWTKAGLDVNGGLTRIDPQSGQLLRELDASGVASEQAQQGGIKDFQFYDGGRHLFSLGGDEREAVTVKRWDTTKNRIERTIANLNDAHVLAVAPNEKTVVVGTQSGELRLYDVATFALKWRRATGSPIADLIWSASGDRVFVGGSDGQTRVFDTQGELKNSLIALPAPNVNSTGYEWINLAADGHYLASGHAGGQLRWRVGASLQRLPKQSRLVAALPLSLDAKLPFRPKTPSSSGEAPNSRPVPTFDARSRTINRQTELRSATLVLQGLNASAVGSLAITDDARWIVSGMSSGNLTLWDGKNTLQGGEFARSRDQEPLLFSPDGKLLFSSRVNYGGGDAHSIEVRLVPEGKLLRKIPLPAKPLWSDGKTLRGVEKGHILAFDVASGNLLWSRAVPLLPPNELLQFSPDGSLLVSGGDLYQNRTARIWRVADGKPILTLNDPVRVLGMAAVSSDGRFLATEGEEISLWSVPTKKLLATFPGYYSVSTVTDDGYSLEGGARLLRFSPDGKWLLSAGSEGGGLARFDVTNHQLVVVPPAPKDDVSPVDSPLAVSRDGATMAAKSRKGGLQIFDVATNRAGRAFAGALSSVSVRWSPDGKYLVSDAGLSVFDAKSGVLLQQARDSYVLDFVWGKDEIQTASLETVTRWKFPPLEKISTWRVGLRTANDPTSDYSDGIRISPDGGTVLTSDPKGLFRGGGKGLFVWDARTHVLRRTMMPDFESGSSSLESLVFFPGGDQILRGTKTGCEAWDLTTGERIRSWRDPIDPNYTVPSASFGAALRPLAVSGDGRLVALNAIRDSSIWIFSMQGNAPPLHLLIKGGTRAQFLRDNRTLVCESRQGLEWWDVHSDGQNAQRIWLGASGARFSPDEKLASVTTLEGSSIWSVPHNRPILSLYLLGSNEPYGSDKTKQDWIALTPAGSYTASTLGEDRLRWHNANTYWPLAKSRARFKNAVAVRASLGQ